ncbi:hypothetical protein KQI52_10395 [bacterium]|nr:hypothetical protein [bacterium]
MKNLGHILLIALNVAIIGYIAYGVYYYFAQTGMIFPAEQALLPTGVREQYPEIRAFWPEADGDRVEAWYLPPVVDEPALDVIDPDREPIFPAPLLVVAHGNKNVIDDWPEQLDVPRAAGWGVLLVEYPGYGRSPGTPSQRVITALYAAAYDSVLAWGVADTSRVVAVGRSLGGGVACAFSQVRETDALILISTFTSVRSFAADYGLPGFLVAHPFDNEAVLREYSHPVLLIHSDDDTVVPYDHALALTAASATDTLITRHNDGHDTLQGFYDEFWRETGMPFLGEVASK